MTREVRIPVKTILGKEWGDLNSLGITHEFVGETVHLKNNQYSFGGGHRVRLYHFKKNVYWRLSTGMELNIKDVAPSEVPQRKRGHNG